MPREEISIQVDETTCTGCGSCVSICPSDTLSLIENIACVTGERCLACDHCGAVCPEGAIRVGAIAEDALGLSTVRLSTSWSRFAAADTADLANLMASRRSCRNYKSKPVSRAVLEDLVKIGTTAPSGSNCQLWSFTVLPTRESCERLCQEIVRFFEGVNRQVEKPAVRVLSRILSKNDELGFYYREYYSRAKQAIEEWYEARVDRLLYGAPATIIVASRPGATCPQDDALLATQNILLAAHTMGLGTCLVGYAVKAMERDKAIQQALAIPKTERVCAVIALGYPDEQYERIAGRKPLAIRFVD